MKFKRNQDLVLTRDLTSFVRNTVIPAGTRVTVVRTALEGSMAQAIVTPGNINQAPIPNSGYPVIVRPSDVR